MADTRTHKQVQSNDQSLQKKIDKVIELQKGIKILKERMALSKKDLIDYFDKNPQLKNTKYVADNYSLRYVNKKATDGITQKLIISGLSQYFKMKGVNDPSREIAQIMSLIKDSRQSKIVPNIDIRALNITTENNI